MIVSDVPKFQNHLQTTDLILDKGSIEFWAKHSERVIFKHVFEYLNKLDKSKEKYNILWLPNLNILVKTKTSRKEFPYRSENN